MLLAGVAAATIIGLFILPLHSYLQAFVATKCGDETPQRKRRLRFNPVRSMDIMGFLFLIFFDFGWSKPVPMKHWHMKRRKKDMIKTILISWIPSLVCILISAIAFIMLCRANIIQQYNYNYSEGTLSIRSASNIDRFFGAFFIRLIMYNVMTIILNFLPFSPMDGFKIAKLYFPDYVISKLKRWRLYFLGAMFLCAVLVGFILNHNYLLNTCIYYLIHGLDRFFALIGI